MKKENSYALILIIILTVIFVPVFKMILTSTGECGVIENTSSGISTSIAMGKPINSHMNIVYNLRGFLALGYKVLPIVFLIPYLYYGIILRKDKKECDKEKITELKGIAKNLFWISLILGWVYATLLEVVVSIDKPIIYLYPEQTQEVSVRLGNEELVTVSYPKYEDSWEVVAEPNGDLTDLETGRKLYALYYESEALTRFKVEDEGFVIKGEESSKFLEEKLETLGLNYKEAEEFIVYWLPKLEANKYNYIRFATREEIEENMPLEISGEPDSVIRVMMTYKGLRKPIEVKEQELTTPSREGFVVVEWGGTEIK